mgnify:CR=1 FL=1
MTILDGQSLGRVLTITFPAGNSTPFTVVLTGLTVQHGNAHGTGFNNLVGGGIADFAGSLVLNDCDVSHNTASTQDDRTAGAASAMTGDLSLLHTTVTANTSGGFSGNRERERLHGGRRLDRFRKPVAHVFRGSGRTGSAWPSRGRRSRTTRSRAGRAAASPPKEGSLAIDHSIVSGNHAGDYGGGVVSEGAISA